MNYKIAFFSLVFCISYSTILVANSVSGKIQYENKLYNSGGFTGIINKLPVRFANVEMVVAGNSIYNCDTDNNGNYSVSIPDSGSQDISIRIYARQNNPDFNLVVKNLSDAIYTVISPTQNLDTNNPQIINLDITIADGAAGAFNIFDMGIETWIFIKELGKTSLASGHKMTFYWEGGKGQGTYLQYPDNYIYINGTLNDPDEFDDDVILHELGHFVANNFSKDNTPGGDHSITGHYDPRLSWSEGWATYWSCATREYAGTTLYPESKWYVDNSQGGVFSFEVETPSYSSSATMATNELAVSYSLWHIATYMRGCSQIWYVLNKIIPTFQEITLEDFIKGWETVVSGSDFIETQNILLARSIKYVVDDKETNDSQGDAKQITGTISNLTFFRNVPYSRPGDKDWFWFDVEANQTATIETLNLGDGADTYLELYDNSRNLLAENDDRAGASDGSSLLQYTFSNGGRYYVKVKPYEGSNQITEFGYYDLKITVEGGGSGEGGGGGCGSIGLDIGMFLPLAYLIRMYKRRYHKKWEIYERE